MGLPLLRLPSLAFHNICQYLDVPDKILLSQCSRRVQDLVSFQEGPRTGRQVVIDFYREYATVLVIRRFNDCSSRLLFTLEIHSSERNRELTGEKSFFHLNIDGTTWDVKKCQPETIGKWYCVSEEGSHEKDVLTIVKMLRNLFNCSISNLRIMPTNANFQKLFVETDALHRADQISIASGEYDPKDVDIMFDHFVTNYLDFWGYCGPEYNYQKPLNFLKICLGHATWINLEKLFEMTKISKYVELYGAKLIGDGDINQFIKWWLTSDTKTLEYLTIARGTYSSPQPSGVEVELNRSVIMEGIETTPGKKKREEATKGFPFESKWEDGVDIIRKDGVRATVLMSSQMFLLAVWYHPNPNVDD